MKYQYHILKNGIKLVHSQVYSPVSHCGLMVGTGSRDEMETENGMAHFIEHMIFKGTTKRKSFQLLGMIENLGGELNAFTTREETCVYASFLSPYYSKSLGLFADVAFNSTFPQREIEKEKMVIIDEINSYLDSPGEQIFDDFEEMVFNNHSLGRNILGTEQNVKKFKRSDVFRFMKRNYRLDNIVIASVGKIEMSKLIKLVEKFFGEIDLQGGSRKRTSFENYQPQKKSESKNTYLSHLMVGNIAYSRTDKKRLPMLLLNNLLGGPALNSRLNLLLREKHGIAYTIESNYSPYSDTGLFSVYLGTDPKNINKSLNLLNKEFKYLRDNSLGGLQLNRAKKQLAGQVAIQYDSRQNEMLSIAKSYLYKPEVKSVESFLDEIEKLQASDILEVANEVLISDNLSTLIFEANEDS